MPDHLPDHQARWEQKKAAILASLSSEEVAALTAASRRSIHQRGETFYLYEGERPCFYVVDRGYCRLCRMTGDGSRLITGFVGPADLFGSLFPGSMGSVAEDYIEVVREARLIAIETDTLRQVLERHPLFLLRLVEILETQNQSLERRILDLVSKDAYAQTASVLLALADKFGDRCVAGVNAALDLGLTHQELADLVGIARPTVSKIISELTRAGLLGKHPGGLCLQNPSGLHALAELGQKALSARL